jgi:hypothetical protein
MPSLLAADLARLGDTPITIRSTFFSNAYLRMDGSGVTSSLANGGGSVNCQHGAGAYERFRVRPQPDGSVAIESAFFDKVFLRMSAAGFTSMQDQGGGTVNCQFNAGSTEKFWARDQADGSVAFESVAYPNVWLRMDATNVTSFTDAGSGTVNCQYGGAGPYEKFYLTMVDQNLAFNMARQLQNQWCWSASSVSIATFHNAASAWTQCSLVNAEFGRNDCCANGSSVDCNKPWYLDRALTRVNHLNQVVNGSLTPAQVGAELAKSCPIGVATMWAAGGGHAVVIRGRFVLNGVEYVSIADPWDGDSDATYANFRDRYRGSGVWTWTFKTRR